MFEVTSMREWDARAAMAGYQIGMKEIWLGLLGYAWVDARDMAGESQTKRLGNIRGKSEKRQGSRPQMNPCCLMRNRVLD